MRLALQEAQRHGLDNSKVGFAAIKIARDLNLDAGPDSIILKHLVAAFGYGESEGAYVSGSGYAEARAEEPIRVTVIYFVTPVGKVTVRDMVRFAQTFS